MKDNGQKVDGCSVEASTRHFSLFSQINDVCLIMIIAFLIGSGMSASAMGGLTLMNDFSKGGGVSEKPPGLTLPRGPIYRTDKLIGPMPTNRWWSSAAWLPFSDPLYAHPLVFKAGTDGLEIGYPPLRVSGGNNPSFLAVFERDLTLGLAGFRWEEALVSDFSDWTVDLQFQSEPARISTRIGHGFPYVYAQYSGATPTVVIASDYHLWTDATGDTGDVPGRQDGTRYDSVDTTGRAAVGITVNSRHYGLFCQSAARWIKEGERRLTCEGPSEGYVSIALLPDDSRETLEIFAAHAFVFPADTTVSWSYDSEQSIVTTVYEVTSQIIEGPETVPLISLYPHQWQYTDAPFTPYVYDSPRGPMKVVASDRIVTYHTYNGILPFLPPLTEEDRPRLHSLFRMSIAQPFWPPGLGTGENDTYWEGKNFNRVAQLLPIAKELGADQAVDLLVDALKERLEYWLLPEDHRNRHVFYYDGDLHSLFGYPASHGSDEFINDHHFHYGYFIHAAAHVALEDPDWAMDEAMGGMIRMLIADWANDRRDDPRFPFLRTFDPFAGHSWASGTGILPHGNNEESSSEAIHAWAGIALFGEATGDTNLRDLGIWGYTLEALAARMYWLNTPGDLFPTGYEPPVIGRLYGAGGDYNTWWTRDADAVHGINFLPITGASLHLGLDPKTVRKNYQYYALMAERSGKDPEQSGWNDILQSYRALADPEEALKSWEDFPAVEFGETPAHTYQWIRSLGTYGNVDATVTANTPLYAVFEKDGVRTYVVYNAGINPVVVTFSDGTQFDVPERSLKHVTSEGERCLSLNDSDD